MIKLKKILSMKVLKKLVPVVLLFSVFSFKCKEPNHVESVDPALKLVATYSLDISEPSGITFNKDHSACWIVSGGDQRIYKTDLKGKVIEKLVYKGEDLEGIFFDHNDQTLWVAEEDLRQLVHLDLTGNEIDRFDTDILGMKNKGLEGLAFDGNNFYVLNEKEPVSIFALDKNFKVSQQYDLSFASDLSDMDYDATTNNFFVLSDESQAMYIWNPKEGLKKKYDLPFTKAEGIAVDPSKKTILLVNDALNTLYKFEYK